MHPASVLRILRITSALCVLPVLAGCFTYDTTVRLNPDGSGTVEQEFVLTGPLAAMVHTSRAAGGEEMELCAPSDLGEGVHLLSAEPLEEEGEAGCRQVYAFTDVNTLRLMLSPEGRLPGDLGPEEDGEEKPEDPITFSFERGSPATLVVRMPEQDAGDEEEDDAGEEGAEAKTPEDAAGHAMALAMMREMLRGSRFTVDLVVAGEIAETDATYRTGDRITLVDIDFDALLKDPETLERLMDVQDSSREAAKELLATTPGVRVETREEVVVRFR